MLMSCQNLTLPIFEKEFFKACRVDESLELYKVKYEIRFELLRVK